MFEFIFLILGILGLVLGAHLVIKGGLSIARHYKISEFFIGLTILAIGSDLPELVVHINGAIKKLQGIDTSGLIVGETIGTCLGQIALTLGIIGLFNNLVLRKHELIRDGLMMVGSVALLFFVSFDGEISQMDGAVFILIYLIYFLSLAREEKLHKKLSLPRKAHLGWAGLSLAGGFLIVIYSSTVVIENALALASNWGISQSIIGSLIIGLGTSLPEIVISISAILKKANGLSVGNLIGSNIFDILFTLGIGSAISGFFVNENLLTFDIPFLFVTSMIATLFFGRNMKIERGEAAILILIYLTYVSIKLIGI